jgi:release factor glutamine methyltransferase
MSVAALPLERRVWRELQTIKLRLWDRRRYGRLVLERIGDMPLVILPEVFNPVLLRSGAFFVEVLDNLLPSRGHVLDLGCGSGAVGIAAARRGCSVVAVDINPAAVRCARINALLNDVTLDVRQGDLFTPVGDERFDVVLFNPPYYRGQPRDALDHAWRSPDVIERFSDALQAHLAPAGRALLVLSSDGESEAFLHALTARGLRSSVVAKRDYRNELMRVYCVC